MKKTLSIHLGRQLFTIEEDAYDRLQAYLKKLEASLAGEEGVSEIIEDIEMRCAEILQEQLNEKKLIVITLSEVEHAVNSLGEPEVISEDAPKPEFEKQSEDRSHSRQRRLFRDTENGSLGGVCTGLAAYLNVDPVVIKILFIIALFMGFGFFLYVVLWIVLPNAKTPSDRLQLRGIPVTVENIKDEINKTASRVKDDVVNASNKFRGNDQIADRARIVVGVIGKILGIGFISLSSMWLVGFTLVTTGILDVFPVTGDQEYASLYEYLGLFCPPNRSLSLLWFSILLTGITAPAIGIILGIRMLLNKKSRFFTYSMVILPIIFATGIILTIVSTIQTTRDFAVYAEVENKHLVIDSNILEVEQTSEYVGNKKVTNSGGFDFIHIEDGQIYSSGVHLKTRPSNDSLFHVYQLVSAHGVDRTSALKRSAKIRHEIDVIGNKLQISPNYNFPLKDGMRDQEVEIVIEVPIGKSLSIAHQPMTDLNEEHNGIIYPGNHFDFFED